MAQINLTFTELIDVTSCVQAYAQEIQSIDRQEWHRLMSLVSDLHRRFAEVATSDDYNVEDLHEPAEEVLTHD